MTDIDPDLYTVLKTGYTNDSKKQADTLSRFGYARDDDLSSDKHQVYYNKDKNKLLFNVNGTQSASDWVTDAYLGAGHLKDTSRYQESKKILEKSKQKYNPSSTSVSGHSLGGSIAQNIAGKDDNIVTLDSGYTIGQRTRGKSYRTAGDIVSLLGSTAKHMTTLKNPNWSTGILPLDILNSHNVDNIKNKSIFI